MSEEVIHMHEFVSSDGKGSSVTISISSTANDVTRYMEIFNLGEKASPRKSSSLFFIA